MGETFNVNVTQLDFGGTIGVELDVELRAAAGKCVLYIKEYISKS